MTMTPQQFLDTVITPTTTALGLGGPAADQLLLGTALQESGLKSRVQIGGGPALGLFQMEPATHDDCWKNFLAYRPGLAARIIALLPDGIKPTASALENNDAYACGMARIKYLRAPQVLPSAGDLDGQAAYYKTYYNGPGAATVAEYVENWQTSGAAACFA